MFRAPLFLFGLVWKRLKPTITSFVETIQVAPTILDILGFDPTALDAVRKEGTQVLPGF
jgi:hypothetical protein